MKKFILIIFSFFIFSATFASFKLVFEYQNGVGTPGDSLAINFYDYQNLKLYPNPASDYLYIDYSIVFVKEAKLQIYNSIGAIVYSKVLIEKADKIKIPVTDYRNGLYFCSLQIDGKLLNTRKILVNH